MHKFRIISRIDINNENVVTINDIKKSDIFSLDNKWVKRPVTGEIKAESLKKIIGKKALKDLTFDTHLSWSDISK